LLENVDKVRGAKTLRDKLNVLLFARCRVSDEVESLLLDDKRGIVAEANENF
jgi:hypothetical protein